MFCPFCRHPDSKVVDSRMSDDGSSIRRRRQCPECGRRFSTIETTSLTVIKRSGVGEAFSRDKVITGVRKACQGRPVTEDDLAKLAQEVEEAIRASGAAQIEAHEVGLAILGPLQKLDRIAYLRFASVYQGFDTLEDFESAIATLRRQPGDGPANAGSAGEAAPAAGTDEDSGHVGDAAADEAATEAAAADDGAADEAATGDGSAARAK